MNSLENFISSGKRTVEIERDAINGLVDSIDNNFAHACEIILACTGKVIVVGMGKSGHIGRKIAATMASTGTPAFFVHPAEASHGDMGMITSQDVILALSNSGTTEEIVTLIPLIKRLGIHLISLTGNPKSTIAKASETHINIEIKKEACPLDLAPTSSSTATLVIGDALAISLLEARGFTQTDFAFSHPGGKLGRRLLIKASDIMHSNDKIPLIYENSLVRNALVEISDKGLGIAVICDQNRKLKGIFTDGDLRRALDKNIDTKTCKIEDVMTHTCTSISKNILATEALQIMESKKINALVCVNNDNIVEGVFNIHDLLRADII